VKAHKAGGSRTLKANPYTPCRSPVMSCRQGFRLCLSHLIYTVSDSHMPCRARAVPRPCRYGSDFSKPQRGMGMAWHVS
jgi:hypothetical protein